MQESIGPGTLRRQTPISASVTNLSGGGGLRQHSPALSQSGQIFNASELGTLPRSGTLPRGASPGPGAVIILSTQCVDISYHFSIVAHLVEVH